jgi:hypothetical protein
LFEKFLTRHPDTLFAAVALTVGLLEVVGCGLGGVAGLPVAETGVDIGEGPA